MLGFTSSMVVYLEPTTKNCNQIMCPILKKFILDVLRRVFGHKCKNVFAWFPT